MDRLLYIAWLLLLALPGLLPAADWRMPAPLGDARLGSLVMTQDLDRVRIAVRPPPGAHQGLTVSMWMRLPRYNNSALTTYAYWCPDTIAYMQPDILAGAGGHEGSAIDLAAAGGSVAFTSLGLTGYAGVPTSTAALWPYGVYTLAGTCTDTITAAVGGHDVTLASGAFNRNVVAGPADDLVVSGAGLLQIGMSRTPCHRFFYEINGVVDDSERLFTRDSIVTNEWMLCAWRFKCEANHQIYRSDLGRTWAFDVISVVCTNSACQALHSAGRYEVGLTGIQEYPPFDLEMFDARVQPRWLEDGELARVHQNGVQELLRRGLLSGD